MIVEIILGRQLVYFAAKNKDQGRRCDLEAGMAINLELENISYCSKEMGPDEKNSGTYIIQSLCHYLDSTKSVTSLEVIRDSYGLSFQRDESGDDSGRFLQDGKGLVLSTEDQERLNRITSDNFLSNLK